MFCDKTLTEDGIRRGFRGELLSVIAGSSATQTLGVRGCQLFNHLAYAAMRCSDQGFITVDQLLAPIALGTQADLQQVARYKEASLVQHGPARDAFVATVSQQLADRLQDCRQFVRGEKAELGIKAPTPPLTNLPADKRDSRPKQERRRWEGRHSHQSHLNPGWMESGAPGASQRLEV
jgi:hypothetical protein